MLSAVVFDFDGIVVDTEPLHYESFQDVLREKGLGYSWEEYEAVYIGFDDRDSFQERIRRSGRDPEPGEIEDLIAKKAEVFIRMAAESPIAPLPGVCALLEQCSGSIPLGLCSGALRSDIDPILERFGLQDAFDLLVTADDVTKSKPDPESYVLALERLSEFHGTPLPASSCVAIEDTPGGMISARHAGLHVLGVTNTHVREQLDGAFLVVDSLEEVSLQKLRGAMANQAGA